MVDQSWDEKIKNIKQSVIKAGEIGLKHFRAHPIQASQKATIHEIVTTQDFEMEKLIKKEINKSFPEEPILAEESPVKVEDNFWTVDALDGTSFYQRGLPDWSINVALIKNAEVVFAITYCPVAGEFFCSEKNKGAYLNDKKISVSETSELKGSILYVGHNYLRNFNDEKSKKIRVDVRSIWSSSSTNLALANLAAGRIDAVIQSNQAFWDITGMLHVVEAGGKFTNWDGQLKFDETGKKANSILATNGKLYPIVFGYMPQCK